jgi:hypothetical protein
MQTRLATRRGPPVPGVIDTIAAGLTVVLAQPLLMAVPLLVDLYFWVGWRATPQALTDPIRRWWTEIGASNGNSTVEALDRVGRSDAVGIVAIFVPSLIAGADRDRLYEFASRPTFAIDSWWLASAGVVALVVLAAGVFTLFSVPLADAATGRTRPVGSVVRAILIAWYRFLGLMALVLGLYLLILGPPAVFLAFLQAFGVGLGPVILPAMVVLGVAMTVFLVFAPEAIVVAEVGPLRAMYLSVNVVRRNLVPTLGLTIASLIITAGLGEIWNRLARTPPGLLTAVVANAFFACGLTMAAMIFFNDRLRQWRPGAAVNLTVPGLPSSRVDA